MLSLPLQDPDLETLWISDASNAREQSVKPIPGFQPVFLTFNYKTHASHQEDGEGLHVLRSPALFYGQSLRQGH